jgi:hypothetical protein
VPADETDLLQKLVTFLTGLGWHTNLSAIEGSGWRAQLDKGGVFVNLRAMLNEFSGASSLWPSPIISATYSGIGLNVGTGYTGTSHWYDEAGVPTWTQSAVDYPVGVMGVQTVGVTAPFTRYHFFADASDNVVVVLEMTPLKFGCFGWGPSLTKSGGTWTGGMYFFGSGGPYLGSNTQPQTQGCPFSWCGWYDQDANGFVRADVDAYTGKWLANFRTLEAQYGKLCASAIRESEPPLQDIPTTLQLVRRSFSALNAQANLIPVDLYAHRDSGGYSLLGCVPNVFATNAATYGNFSSATVYSIGGDDYMVFAGKASGPEIPGFAIKKT